MAGFMMPRLMVQGAGRSPRRRQAALARLRAITTLAGTTLLVPAFSLTLDGQRRVQSNRVHPATPETQPFAQSILSINSLSLSLSLFLSFSLSLSHSLSLYFSDYQECLPSVSCSFFLSFFLSFLPCPNLSPLIEKREFLISDFKDDTLAETSNIA